MWVMKHLKYWLTVVAWHACHEAITVLPFVFNMVFPTFPFCWCGHRIMFQKKWHLTEHVPCIWMTWSVVSPLHSCVWVNQSMWLGWLLGIGHNYVVGELGQCVHIVVLTSAMDSMQLEWNASWNSCMMCEGKTNRIRHTELLNFLPIHILLHAIFF